MSLRVGLIADTHIPEARPQLWDQVFAAFEGVDAILHAGDIYEHAVLDALHAVAPLQAVRGNGEDGSGHRPRQPDHPLLHERTVVVELGGLRIGMVHDLPDLEVVDADVARRAIVQRFGDEELDVIVYGDSHVEAVDLVDDVLCVNPGSPTYPHNLNVQLGTIGFLDIDDAGVTASIWRLQDDGIVPYDWSTWRRPSGSRRSGDSPAFLARRV